MAEDNESEGGGIRRRLDNWTKAVRQDNLGKNVFPDYGYVNLEAPGVHRAAESDGADFMAKHPAQLIIDEVQRVPEILNRIHFHAATQSVYQSIDSTTKHGISSHKERHGRKGFVDFVAHHICLPRR